MAEVEDACYPRGLDGPSRHSRVPKARVTGCSALTLTAIGVVYGDIGTSPLYTIRECFFGTHSVAPTYENVLGVLSLILYALIIVVSIKYIVVVMRADNQGEGGILALTALLPPAENGGPDVGARPARHLRRRAALRRRHDHAGHHRARRHRRACRWPRRSSARTSCRCRVVDHHRHLRSSSSTAPHRVGGLFGPVMVVWFVAIAVLGVAWIARAPAVLGALDPRHAVTFFSDNGWHGFPVLGAVVLAVTGGEALYADMGHFGKRPIRIAWFALVLPGADAELLRAGRAAAARPARRRPTPSSAGAGVGPVPAGRARHARPRSSRRRRSSPARSR